MLRSLRHGFATNSSSSHSVIFSPDRPTAWTPSKNAKGRYHEDYALLGKTQKAKALANLMPAMDKLSAHDAIALMDTWRKHKLNPQWLLDRDSIPHYDLQGTLAAPPKNISLDLWIDMILDPAITLHGFPDHWSDENPDHPLHPLTGHAYQIMGSAYDTWHWKADGKAIIGFNPNTGMKFRYSPTPYEKSAVPELVDVKITDWCGYGCAFCYQGSTKQGQHAPLSSILSIFDDLADWGVFEVALGGGEPTSHPDLPAILEGGKERGLSVSFTTFNDTFDTERTDLIETLQSRKNTDDRFYDFQPFGAIGFSVHNAKGVSSMNSLRTRLSKLNVFSPVCAQAVIGATPMPVLERVVDTSIENDSWLLLLGYKTTGRGLGRNKAVDEQALLRILEKAKEATQKGAWTKNGDNNFCLSVDTAFLDQYGHLLDALQVPLSLRSSPEGKFSMYVDAVAQTCGPSSYADPNRMLPLAAMRTTYKEW